MDTITGIFTRRPWNPVSLGIRWAIPRSRFALAESSHCLIADGDYRIEAHMLHGVRRVPEAVAMKGLMVARWVEYAVPDAEAGLAWAREQVGDRYDWPGAFGLCLAVDRDWQEPGAWNCYELLASTLAAAGRRDFADVGHVTGSHLLMLRP